MAKIAVVIPTKNEEKSIALVISGIRDEIRKLGHEISDVYVVDDSLDSTRAIAEANHAKLVVGGGRGLGHAMFKGIKQSLVSNPDFILTLDGDGQADISQLHNFLLPAVKNQADLVIGSRFLQKNSIRYSYKAIHRLGICILAKILRSMTKLPITDSHGGLRIMTAALARELQLIGTYTYVQESIIDANEKGFRILEIPCNWLPREFGSTKVVSSITLYIFYTLPVLFLRSKSHIKLFYPLSLGLIVPAVACLSFMFARMVFAAAFDYQLFYVMMFLILLGFIFFISGLILELLIGIQKRT